MFLAIQKNDEITSHAPSHLHLSFLFLQLKPKIIHTKIHDFNISSLRGEQIHLSDRCCYSLLMQKPAVFCVTIMASVTHEADAVRKAGWHTLPCRFYSHKNEKLLNVKL